MLPEPHLSMTLTARAIKWNWKKAESIKLIIQRQNHATSYLWPRGMHAHTHTRTHTV